uniref:Alkaline phosphatase n=1 Tax=Salmo trutta TaxID=8032 RepID=A0A674A8Y9_SALTR
CYSSLLSIVCYSSLLSIYVSGPVEEENPEFWRAQGCDLFLCAIPPKVWALPPSQHARILKGQMHNQSGEETVMTMDTFPHAGLLKTYSVDFQIPDSSSTATAYLCGVKTNLNTVGVNAAARNGICKTQKGNEVTSILKWAKDAGKSVGIVTTTRASRKWYSDADMPASAKKEGCTDISQNPSVDPIRVIVIHELCFSMTQRDGRHLISDWQKMKVGKVARYVWNRTDFDAVDPDTTDYLMALFEPGDLRFDVERDPTMDPSIAETTEKAIHQCLWVTSSVSFPVCVSGGRIDQGHHASRASMALHETVAFDNAVAKGLELTNEEETLTLVTADHSHAFTFNGYPFRGQSILGKSPLYGKDMLPYTTLMYGNGPGYKVVDNKRPDIRNVDTQSKDYVQLSAVPLDTETHGGEDVAVLARGPMAHLFHGVQEQSYLAHAMAYAGCVGRDLRHCESRPQHTNTQRILVTTTDDDRNSAPSQVSSISLVTALLAAVLH